MGSVEDGTAGVAVGGAILMDVGDQDNGASRRTRCALFGSW